MADAAPTFPVPYELMPVAAALLVVAVLSLGRAAVLQLQRRRADATAGSRRRHPAARPPATVTPALLWVSGLLALVAYSYVVGRVQGSLRKQEHARFDPYAVLQVKPPPAAAEAEGGASGIDAAKNYTAQVTAAYRALVKRVHPSNKETGSQARFEAAVWAYRALTEEEAAAQWRRHGHPEGPLLTPVFVLALPRWLVTWEAPVRRRMQLVVSAFLLVVLALAGSHLRGRSAKAGVEDDDAAAEEEDRLAVMQNQVLEADLRHLVQHLRPDLTHLQVLYVALTSPRMMVQWSRSDLRRIEQARSERIATLAAEQAKDKSEKDWDALLENDDGWADDDEAEGDDNNPLVKARQEEEEKRKQMEMLKRVTGKTTLLIEGVDHGVIGQKWVRQTLTTAEKWPLPDLESLRNMTPLDPLQDPALARLLCMLTGRLHSQFLNTHADLLAAAAAGPPPRIDQTYFAAGAMFRQRMRLLLEAILRMSITLRCAPLVKTTVEAIAMFMVGIQAHEAAKCHDMLTKQMKCVPRLQVQDPPPTAETEGESNLVADDAGMALKFVLERVHAKALLTARMEAWKKQGIPPELGFQTFREVWWVVIEGQRLDSSSGNGPRLLSKPMDRNDPIFSQLGISEEALAAFETASQAQPAFLGAHPLVVTNPTQNVIQGRIALEAPSEPGDYKFTVCLKSHEYLGCDTEFSIDAEILSPAAAGREAKLAEAPKDAEVKEAGDDEENNHSEGKKDK